MGPEVDTKALRDRIAEYLAQRHTATVATAVDGRPHAATVYYVTDGALELLFVSRGSSRHGREIEETGRVAVTVADSDQDWSEIQGVQLWGRATALRGPAKVNALSRYVSRFPFAVEAARAMGTSGLFDQVEIYRVTVERAAFTDNRTGLFGREVLDLS